MSTSNLPPFPPPFWFPPDFTTPRRRSSSSGLDTRILATALIVLAFVLALVVSLHLYFRLVVRHRRRLSSLALLRLSSSSAPPPPSSGLDAASIASLPTFHYQKNTNNDSYTNNTNENSDNECNPECSVCLSTVEEGERVRRLPGCGHLFHVECIDMWLWSHSTCPVCRAGVEAPVDDVAVAVGGEVASTSAVGKEMVRAGSTRRSSSFRRMMVMGRDRRVQDDDGHEDDVERQ